MIRRLLIAASYVTTLPFLPRPEIEADLWGLAKYLPAVGTIIGITLAALFFAFNLFIAQRLVVAALILVTWILLTGAIHLDGLMDSADGLLSHRSRERMLEIMKDSRVGNYGVIAGVCLLLCKFSALSCINSQELIAALLMIPAWARWTEMQTIAAYPYAREEGMGKIWKLSTRSYQLLPAAIVPAAVAIAVVLFFHNWRLMTLIPMTVLPGMALAFWINAILKGHTGDTYGSVVEFSEMSGLVGAAILFGT